MNPKTQWHFLSSKPLVVIKFAFLTKKQKRNFAVKDQSQQGFDWRVGH